MNVDGDRMRWLFQNYGFGWRSVAATPPDDDDLADFIEDLRHDFAHERSAGAAPLDVEVLAMAMSRTSLQRFMITGPAGWEQAAREVIREYLRLSEGTDR